MMKDKELPVNPNQNVMFALCSIPKLGEGGNCQSLSTHHEQSESVHPSQTVRVCPPITNCRSLSTHHEQSKSVHPSRTVGVCPPITNCRSLSTHHKSSVCPPITMGYYGFSSHYTGMHRETYIRILASTVSCDSLHIPCAYRIAGGSNVSNVDM